MSDKTIKKSFARLRRLFFLSPAEKSIELLVSKCNDKCIPIVAYIPNSSLSDRDFMDKCNSKIPKRICSIYYGDFVEKLRTKSDFYGIKFIDGGEVINRNDPEFYAPEGLHLSKKGYKFISNLIIKEINQY